MFDDEERMPLSVTELNEQIKTSLERTFSHVWIEAEIFDFSEPSSGHWYFSLQDGKSKIRAACFKGTNWKIRFRPFDGIQVRIRGKVSVYTVKGEYQILVDSLEPVGEGALRVAFEQVKSKLRSEGLFSPEHKQRLPFLPKRVGVVTSPTGAAIFDILNVISRRTRTVDVVLIPAVVQGETAPESIRSGIILANEFNAGAQPEQRLDVLIVGRGGGSAEDLAAFNEEHLARTIFASKIPIISAVGHEVDTTIADFVADMRAPTPSAAAELVAQREDELSQRIIDLRTRAAQLLEHTLTSSSNRLRMIRESGALQRFPDRIDRLREQNKALAESLKRSAERGVSETKERLAGLQHRLSPVKLANELGAKRLKLSVLGQKNAAAVRNAVAKGTEELKVAMAGLNALSPLAVLERGYSIARNAQGSVISDSADVETGDILDIVLAHGELEAEVKSKS